MSPSPTPQEREQLRLAALRQLSLLDTPRESELDRLTSVVADALNVPICAVALMDANRLWFKSEHGMPATECPRDISFCNHVVDSGRHLVCPDLRADPRFEHNPLVTASEGAVSFYAGAPVIMDGHVIGTLCVLDTRPRPDFQGDSTQRLLKYAEIVQDALLARQERVQIRQERELFADGPVAALVWSQRDGQLVLTHHSANLSRLIGPQRAALIDEGHAFESLILKKDIRCFRDALKSHQLSRLAQLETVYRLDNGRTWLQQTTYGDYDDQGHLVRIRAYLADVSRQKRLEATIETTKERLYLALESASIGTWDLSLASQERLVNARTAAMLGYRQDEADLSVHGWLAMIHPFDRARVAESLQQHISHHQQQPLSHEVFTMEYRLQHKAGHYIWVQSCGKAVMGPEESSPSRIVGTLIDISAQKAAEMERQRNQQLLDLLNTTQRSFLLDKSLDAACEALFTPLLKLTDSQFGFIGIVERDAAGAPILRVPSISNISWNAETQRWYDAQRQTAQGLVFSNLDNLFGRTVTHNEVVCTNQPSQHPASKGLPKGHPVLDSFLGLPLRFNDQVVGMIGLGNRDEGFDEALVQLLTPLTTTLGTLIHARSVEVGRMRAEAQLFSQATEDSLTGLANRRRFFDICEQAMARARRYGDHLCLAIMDLDHFKRINDQHGHAAGDEVLKHFAQLLKAHVRDADLAARIGGEEFVVLMPDTALEQALVPLERLRSQLCSAPMSCGDDAIPVSVSIGVCAWQPELNTPDLWLAQADAALYRAKAEGRNRIEVAGPTT